jgi:hypothetical protein
VINEKEPPSSDEIKLYNAVNKNFQILDFFNKSEKQVKKPYITVDATVKIHENSG